MYIIFVGLLLLAVTTVNSSINDLSFNNRYNVFANRLFSVRRHGVRFLQVPSKFVVRHPYEFMFPQNKNLKITEIDCQNGYPAKKITYYVRNPIYSIPSVSSIPAWVSKGIIPYRSVLKYQQLLNSPYYYKTNTIVPNYNLYETSEHRFDFPYPPKSEIIIPEVVTPISITPTPNVENVDESEIANQDFQNPFVPPTSVEFTNSATTSVNFPERTVYHIPPKYSVSKTVKTDINQPALISSSYSSKDQSQQIYVSEKPVTVPKFQQESQHYNIIPTVHFIKPNPTAKAHEFHINTENSLNSYSHSFIEDEVTPPTLPNNPKINVHYYGSEVSTFKPIYSESSYGKTTINELPKIVTPASTRPFVGIFSTSIPKLQANKARPIQNQATSIPSPPNVIQVEVSTPSSILYDSETDGKTFIYKTSESNTIQPQLVKVKDESAAIHDIHKVVTPASIQPIKGFSTSSYHKLSTNHEKFNHKQVSDVNKEVSIVTPVSTYPLDKDTFIKNSPLLWGKNKAIIVSKNFQQTEAPQEQHSEIKTVLHYQNLPKIQEPVNFLTPFLCDDDKKKFQFSTPNQDVQIAKYSTERNQLSIEAFGLRKDFLKTHEIKNVNVNHDFEEYSEYNT